MTVRKTIDPSPVRPKVRFDPPEITARPKNLSDELHASHLVDSGLSIDADDLGMQFLKDATEQGFDSQRDGAATDLGIVSAGPSDDALPGPNFEGDQSVWENTVSLAMQHRGAENALEDAAPADLPVDADEEEDAEQRPREQDDSLFDEDEGR